MSEGLKSKYFVLSPEAYDLNHARASRAGMEAYANAIEHCDLILASALMDWVRKAEKTESCSLINYLVGRCIECGTIKKVFGKVDSDSLKHALLESDIQLVVMSSNFKPIVQKCDCKL